MVTCLNYPLHTFGNAVHRVNFSLMSLGPMSESIARRCTDCEARRAMQVVNRDLEKLRDGGTVFTLTADEWAWQRKRFLGVTLHPSARIPSLGKTWVPLLARFHERAQAKAESPYEEGEEELEIGTWQFVATANEDSDIQEVLEAEELLAGVPTIRGPPGELVAKVRRVCRAFHKSGLLNDQLVKQSGRTDDRSAPKCALDVKTRWNSTLRMLRGFVGQRDSIKAVYTANLKHFQTEPWPFNADGVRGIEELINVLKIVERATKRLSEADLTIRNADRALELMLRDVKERQTDFAKALYRNLCFRILQRRGVASRLARYLQRRDENTPLDTFLEAERVTYTEKQRETFAEFGRKCGEIDAFLRLDAAPVGEQRAPTPDNDSDSDDGFELLKDRDEDEDEDGPATAELSPETLMEIHKQGAKRVFPESIYRTFESLQATSVPAELSFSVARHARRFCQESLSDERFENYLFLKHIYQSDKPWERFLETQDSQNMHLPPQ